MLVSLRYMRAGARRLALGTLLVVPAACSGGDLLLPEDRAPAQLRALSGDGQTAVAGAPVPNPLVVEVRDAANRPVEGAAVVFQFVEPTSGAAIAPPVAQTDPSGQAAVEVVLGRPAGDQPVMARLDVPERELSDTFSLTAIPPNTGGGGDDDDDEAPPPPPPPSDGDGDNDDGGGGNGGGGGDDDDGGGGDGGGGDDDDNSGEGGGGGGNEGEGGGDDEDDDDEDDDDEDDDDEGNQGKGGKGKGGGGD